LTLGKEGVMGNQTQRYKRLPDPPYGAPLAWIFMRDGQQIASTPDYRLGRYPVKWTLMSTLWDNKVTRRTKCQNQSKKKFAKKFYIT